MTPCIFYFCFSQDSGRVHVTWYPRENRVKNAGVTPCILGHISCCVLPSVFVFADVLRLCFCRPAFASAFVSYIEAARGRVRGESYCKHFSDNASFGASVRTLATIISAVNSTCFFFSFCVLFCCWFCFCSAGRVHGGNHCRDFSQMLTQDLQADRGCGDDPP